MDLSSVFKLLQSRIDDGVLLVIGSGLSCAEGMPGMGELGAHLAASLNDTLSISDQTLWEPIRDRLAQAENIETVLQSSNLTDTLLAQIVAHTADFMVPAERRIISDIVSNGRKLMLTPLLVQLLKIRNKVDIVTPNYDRLIEIAAEQARVFVDSGFVGSYCRVIDEQRRKDSLTVYRAKGKTILRQELKHVCVHKPHGSLDWFTSLGKPVSCSIPVDAPRLMITPGSRKYREGYNMPFDIQRAAANEAIDRASGYLCIGYGFNDEQLETHLCPARIFTKPALILTRDLTCNSDAIAAASPQCIAVYKCRSEEGTEVRYQGASHIYPNVDFWSVSGFAERVLGATK